MIPNKIFFATDDAALYGKISSFLGATVELGEAYPLDEREDAFIRNEWPSSRFCLFRLRLAGFSVQRFLSSQSGSGPEDFRCRGRSLATCFDEISLDWERGDQEFVFHRPPPFGTPPIKEECKSDYPHALQALWKALDRAEDLIQN